MTSATRICPICDHADLRPETYTEQVEHNGAVLTVTGLERCRCGNCGADPVLRDQIRRNQVRLSDARRHADGLLTADQIRATRERFDMSQADAALVFGGGANAFSKYERGEVTQSVAMDRLLRCATEFPESVDYLRYLSGTGARTIVVETALVEGNLTRSLVSSKSNFKLTIQDLSGSKNRWFGWQTDRAGQAASEKTESFFFGTDAAAANQPTYLRIEERGRV